MTSTRWFLPAVPGALAHLVESDDATWYKSPCGLLCPGSVVDPDSGGLVKCKACERYIARVRGTPIEDEAS